MVLFQVLRHPNVRHVTMVELDESVVEVSKSSFHSLQKLTATESDFDI